MCCLTYTCKLVAVKFICKRRNTTDTPRLVGGWCTQPGNQIPTMLAKDKIFIPIARTASSCVSRDESVASLITPGRPPNDPMSPFTNTCHTYSPWRTPQGIIKNRCSKNVWNVVLMLRCRTEAGGWGEQFRLESRNWRRMGWKSWDCMQPPDETASQPGCA